MSAEATELEPAVFPAPYQYRSAESIEVRWLPSMPLLNKRHTPAVRGVGILYSEDLDQIFHVFETENLCHSINNCSRQQAVALARDPNCRICWYEVETGGQRNQLLQKLRSKMVSQLAIVVE